MSALAKIWTFIKSVFKKENMATILVVAGVVFFLLWLQQCNRNGKLRDELEFEKEKSAQNVAAMTEQIKVIKNLQGEMESSKAAYIGKLSEIQKYDSALYERFKRQEGLLAGIYADFSVKLDSLMSKDDNVVSYSDSTYGIQFETVYDKDELFNRITGETKFQLVQCKPNPLNTTIFSNEMRIGISYGFRELKDRYEVFAISKSDKVKFNELEGVFTLKKPEIAPVKKLRWGVGPQVGVTFSISQMKVMPYFGVGLHYSLIRF